VPMPSWRATLVTAPWRSPASSMVSATMRTARSLSSGGYLRWNGRGLLGADMTPSSSKEWSLHRSQDA
jgi:hypothetical protein